MQLTSIRCIAAGFVTLLLAACVSGSRPVVPPSAASPANFPERDYREASGTEPVYRIDRSSSRILIYVYRDGPLAKLGHDHVVASHDVHGYALLPDRLANARADFYFPVAAMTVDEPELRRAAGFTTEISATDIESTRQRMQRVVLEAEKYPLVRVHAVPGSGTPPRLNLSVDVTLHGITRALKVPATLAVDSSRFRADGEAD